MHTNDQVSPLAGSDWVQDLGILSFRCDPLVLGEFVGFEFFHFHNVKLGNWLDASFNTITSEVADNLDLVINLTAVGIEPVFSCSSFGEAHLDVLASFSWEFRAAIRFGFAEDLDLKTIDEIEHVQLFTILSGLILEGVVVLVVVVVVVVVVLGWTVGWAFGW